MKIRILLASLALLLSCSSEVELEQPAYTSKIVVDGTIETGEHARIYLTRSSPFLTDYDSASILATFLNTASVRLTCSDGTSEQLTLFRETGFFPPFVYKSIRMKGEAGKSYTLDIEADGKHLTAETRIPESPLVWGTLEDLRSDSSMYLHVMVWPDSVETLYLFLRYRSLLAGDEVHPAGVPLYKLDPAGQIRRLVLYRSEATNLYLQDREDDRAYRGWPGNVFSREDALLVKVGCVDVASYQVLKSLFVDQSVKTNPFAFNSSGLVSNIKGGLGRWTGIGSAEPISWP